VAIKGAVVLGAFCLGASLSARGGPSAVGAGAEADWNSRYVWHGIAFGRGATFNPSSWISAYDVKFSVWGNGVLGKDPGRGKFNEVDLSVTCDRRAGKLGVEPFYEHYDYSRQNNVPDTGMAGVRISYPVGVVELFARPAWDVVKYAGADFVDIGASYEKELNEDTGFKLTVGGGAGSANFNLAYLGVRKGALNLASTDMELTYRATKSITLRPHASVTRLLDRDLRARVERPALIAGGFAVDWEF